MGKQEVKPKKNSFFDDVKPIGNPLIPAVNPQRTQEELGITSQDKEDYGKFSEGEDINKLRYENQSGLEQVGSFATQSLGEIVGGAISGIGATLDVLDPINGAIAQEAKGKDADFRNLITDAGDAISQWSKDIAPIYRKNPGKAFDVSDSGWWLENGVSIASTLSLLIPAVGSVKGASYVGKMLGLSDELATASKLGKAFNLESSTVNKIAGSLEKAKYFGKIGTSAIVSRNAENFKESAQVLTNTKEALLDEWDKNPEKYSELLKSDVAQELISQGRTPDKENLSNFIASKAAWLSYGVNSLNIMFDAMQLAPLFKGFKPVTQISKAETSIGIKAAQKAALGKTLSKSSYLSAALNPLSSSVARNATEGIEEFINYVGTKEGENYAKKLTGEKTKDFADRAADYLVDPKAYESAVWGVLGGMAFGGASNALGKVANLVKGKDGNSLKEARIDEINNRVSQMKETAAYIKSVEEDPNLNDETKSQYIANAKSDTITKLAINAAQVGNYDMLVEHLSSPEMRKQMIDAGYATEEDVDKAIANSLSDAETAIDIYKSNYNLFQTRNIDENTKNIQIANKTYWDSISKKHLEQKNKLTKDVEVLKANDNYINSTTDKNVSATIQLEALKAAKKSILNITENSNEPLSQYQKEILATADKKIEDLDKTLTEKATLNTLNPKILEKQTQIEQKNMIIEALGHKANYMTTPAYSEKIKSDVEKVQKEKAKKDIEDFTTSLQGKSEQELQAIKESVFKDKAKTKIVDDLLTNINKDKEKEQRKQNVQQTKEKLQPKVKETTTPVADISSPVINKTDDELFDFFKNEFKQHTIDESKLNPSKKQTIDTILETGDRGDLLAAYTAYKGSLEGNYIENKITEVKQQLLSEHNKAVDISNLNEVPVSSNFEDGIDEEALHKLETVTPKKDKDENGLIFAKEVSVEKNQESIKPLVDILKLIDFAGNTQISEDKQGNLIVSKTNDKAIEALYELKIGDKLNLKIDPSNKLYEANKDNKEDVPVGVYINDSRIGYISSISKFKGTAEELSLLKQIRNTIETDTKKSVEAVLSEKTNGDVINTKEYYNIKDMNLENYEFYTVKSTLSHNHTLERLSKDKAEHTNPKKPYGKEFTTPVGTVNLRGILYLMLHNVNGSPFPTPLKVTKISNKDSKVVENKVNQLLTLLDEGQPLNSQVITNLKDEIAGYIKVDDTRDIEREQNELDKKRSEYLKYEKIEDKSPEIEAKYNKLKAEYKELQNKRKLSFRVHAKTEKAPARIELTYIADDGSKRLVVLNKDKMWVTDLSSGKLLNPKKIDRTNAVVFGNQKEGDSALSTILQRKYYNINFKTLRTDDGQYAKRLINEGVLQTNVGEIKTSTGKTLGNFSNFGIRFNVDTDKLKAINLAKNTDVFTKTNYSLYNNTKSNSSEILDEIINNAKSPLIKQAAEDLKANKNIVEIGFKELSNEEDLAIYSSTENKIFVSTAPRFRDEQQFQETILHEIVHAATVLPLIKYLEVQGTNKDDLDFTNFKFKENTPEEVKAFVTEMDNLRKKSKEVLTKKYGDLSTTKIEKVYGVENVFEFISEVFSNPEFKEAIKEDKNLIERILDSITNFINKLLKVSPVITQESAIREIVKFVGNQNKDNYEALTDGTSPSANKNYVEFRKLTEKKITDVFTNEEKNHLLNFTNVEALKYFKNSEVVEDIGNENEQELNTAKKYVESQIKKTLKDSTLNDNQRALLEKSIENFDILWKATVANINRTFRVTLLADEADGLDVSDTQELQKNWDDKVALSVSMNEQLSKEVKWFIATTSLYNEDGTIKSNIVTGLPEYLNYASNINILIKHLSSAQTELELLNKLRTLKVVNPSFEIMANNLEKDTNLLAAFKSQFTRNILSSNILLISKVEDFVKAKVENELKKTQGYISIADDWNKKINVGIDNEYYTSKEFKDDYNKLAPSLVSFQSKGLEENYLSTGNELTEKGKELVDLLFKYSNLLQIGLSIPAIEDSVKHARTVNDVTILTRLSNIYNTVKKGSKNDSNQNLNEIAKFEDKYSIALAEIMALNIKGEPVYAAQLPSFLTNFFARLKSQNKEIREQFEREFKLIVENDPTFQYSNWAWSDDNNLGLFKYTVIGNKKVPTEIDSNYVSLWEIARLGGAKNTISKDVQDYTELNDTTYKVTLGFMYLDHKDKVSKGNNYAWIPTLIPSDSGTFTMVKVNRFALKNGDLITTKDEKGKILSRKLSETSNIFKAIQNGTKQEIERIQQAYDLVFDITGKEIKLKSEYYNEATDSLTEEGKKWFSLLEKNFHYKTIIYKEGTNEVDAKNTLLSNSKPTGRAFQFHNLRLVNNGKFEAINKNKSITLSDLKDFQNFHELIGNIDENFINQKINPFISEYTRQLIENEISEYKDIQNEGIFKPTTYGFIGDGSFENFVAEMALNNYIHNIEQQNWFNGVSAEYKNNVDTNKRAKQMLAPGTAPSTIGSPTYNAITIQDINLKSKTLDTIKDKVREQLKKEKGYKDGDLLLDAEVNKITKDYSKINSGDAQGYITVKGLKELMTKYGMMNDTYTKIFEQIESGKQLNTEAIKTLQAVKPFAYERSYNNALNKMSSNQIKLSYLPLIPQLTAGTDLEKLAKVMDEKNVSRAFFESAHKVGAKQIYKIADENGKIVDEWLNATESQSYLYSAEQLQLTVPDHLVDTTNLLATQIAKLIVANLSNEPIYELHGKKITGDELKAYYFKLLTTNIEESKDKLLSDIKISKDEDGNYKFENNEVLRDLLLEEISSRGLGKNYEDAIELNPVGEFVLPLFTGKNAEKWESILTSLFTNRIMKQKMPGASLVLASDLFTKQYTQESFKDKFSIKTGIDKIFEENSKFKEIGNKNQYSKYLDSIFPNTIIKDIVYHGGQKGLKESGKFLEENQGQSNLGIDRGDKGFYFSPDVEGAKLYNKGEIIQAIIDIKGEEIYTDDNEYYTDGKIIKEIGTNEDGETVVGKIAEYVVNKNTQIHILGTEKDFNDFKKFVENNKETSVKGIEWQEGHDGVLKSYTEKDGKLQVVEVVMGSWSEKLFKDGQRISIDTIPDDIKTMIGYRIPTQAKHSMVVFKVVGFLPEESKGTIIMPNDIITQMGSDFDIDKLFIMYKNFVQDSDGNFTTDIKEGSYKKLKALEKEVKAAEDNEILDKLVNDMFKYLDEDFEDVELTSSIAKNKLEYITKKIERQDRENEIIEIYKTILTNAEHLKESFTPATFEDFIEGKKIIDKLFNTSDDDIDILSPQGQRTFRKRNMAGRVLKGAAANFNAFVPIAQNTGMYLKESLSYIQKVKIKGNPINTFEGVYDLSELQKRYTNIKVEGDYAYITLSKIGKSDSGSYLNIDGNIITEVASQGIGAAVDIVKDPTFDAFNATTYTYPQFNLGLILGANPKYMMFFTRQPILKMLNDEYFNNQSILGDNVGEEREKVRAIYESLLYNALISKGDLKGEKIDNILTNYKKFNKEDRQKFFGYTIEDNTTFSDGELYQMLEQSAIGHGKLPLDERVVYYKNQLLILNQFNRNREAGDAVQNVLRSIKTDALGAGPSLNKTVDLNTLIHKSANAEKVFIKTDSAVKAIYPKLFGKKEDSVYPVIESYYHNVNELSYLTLSGLFITQNANYINFKNNLKQFGLTVNKNTEKTMKKFFNKTILQDFNQFDETEKERVLGTSSYKESKLKFEGDIDSFKQLSTQDKLTVFQSVYTNTLQGQSNILNVLVPSDKFEELGYSKIDFNTNYKDTNVDDMYAEQLENLYFSGNEFAKELVIDLMRYNYFVNGMEFGFGSISKVFPPRVLVSEGIGEHLYSKNGGLVELNMNLNQFYRNNAANGDIVPKVRPKYQKVNGKKVPQVDSQGREIEHAFKTIDNTPQWNVEANILAIPASQLKNEPAKVKNSPYIVLTKTEKEEGKAIHTPYLYVKHVNKISLADSSQYDYVMVYNKYGENIGYKKQDISFTENGLYKLTVKSLDGKETKEFISDKDGIVNSDITITPEPRTVYYYKVNPLGKDGIIELSNKSLWLDNNLVNEDKNLQELQNRIEGINKNSIGLPNITQEQIDEHNKNCF